MYNKQSEPRRRTEHAALMPALAVILLLTLLCLTLLASCGKSPKPDASPAQTTGATAEPTVPETTLPAPTEAAGTESAAPSVPETEPAPSDTVPADWTPSLNRTDISFFGVGESFVLSVPGAPASLEILWSAEDETIAAVDETGRVTAVGPGSARVLAEVNGTELTCWIRCKFSAPAEGEPALDKTDISFFGVGENYRLSVSNAPEGAQILWTSEDYGVASVDGTGRVRAVGPGTIRVTAQVGETTLSCWVRCQFEAPEVPRSSVADGSWLAVLYKDRVTVLDEEAGVCVAQADLLGRVQVAKEVLDRLEPYEKLDLSAFGMGTFRVSSVAFSEDGNVCTVVSGDSVLLFGPDGGGQWILQDQSGEPVYCVCGAARFVFDDNSVILDQMSAVLEGKTGGPIRRGTVLDLFGRQPGFEDELPRVGLTVSGGLVTEALWYYHP